MNICYQIKYFKIMYLYLTILKMEHFLRLWTFRKIKRKNLQRAKKKNSERKTGKKKQQDKNKENNAEPSRRF